MNNVPYLDTIMWFMNAHCVDPGNIRRKRQRRNKTPSSGLVGPVAEGRKRNGRTQTPRKATGMQRNEQHPPRSFVTGGGRWDQACMQEGRQKQKKNKLATEIAITSRASFLLLCFFFFFFSFLQGLPPPRMRVAPLKSPGCRRLGPMWTRYLQSVVREQEAMGRTTRP